MNDKEVEQLEKAKWPLVACACTNPKCNMLHIRKDKDALDDLVHSVQARCGADWPLHFQPESFLAVYGSKMLPEQIVARARMTSIMLE